MCVNMCMDHANTNKQRHTGGSKCRLICLSACVCVSCMWTAYEGCNGRLLHESIRSSVAGTNTLNLQRAPEADYLDSSKPGQTRSSPNHYPVCRATSTASTIHRTSGLRAEHQLRPCAADALVFWKVRRLETFADVTTLHHWQCPAVRMYFSFKNHLPRKVSRALSVHPAFKGGR